MDLFSLSYISCGTQAMDTVCLQKMNADFSMRNESNGITGVLFVSEGMYFQTIEGKKSKVLDLMDKIAKDPIHDRINIVSQIEITDRVFPFWHMKYFDASLTSRFPEARLEMLKEQDEFVFRLHKIFLKDQTEPYPRRKSL